MSDITFKPIIPNISLTTSATPSHITPFAFTDGGNITPDGTYLKFGQSYRSSDTKFSKGSNFKTRVQNSRTSSISKLGNRKTVVRSHNVDIINKNKTAVNTSKNKLLAVPEPSNQVPEIPTNGGTTLLDILKENGENNSIVVASLVSAIDQSNKQAEAHVKALRQQNSILIEQLGITNSQLHMFKSFSETMNETLMSVGQSLAYLPNVVEAISIASDKATEVANIGNNHAFQKNVNDAYSFNYNKDDEKSPKRSLDIIGSNLANLNKLSNLDTMSAELKKSATANKSIATETSRVANKTAEIATAQTEIEKHQDKQGKLAHEQKLDSDALNESSFMSDFVDSFVDGLLHPSDLIDDVFNEANIFQYVLNEAKGDN